MERQPTLKQILHTADGIGAQPMETDQDHKLTAIVAEAKWWHVRVAMAAMGEDVKQECRDRMARLEEAAR